MGTPPRQWGVKAVVPPHLLRPARPAAAAGDMVRLAVCVCWHLNPPKCTLGRRSARMHASATFVATKNRTSRATAVPRPRRCHEGASALVSLADARHEETDFHKTAIHALANPLHQLVCGRPGQRAGGWAGGRAGGRARQTRWFAFRRLQTRRTLPSELDFSNRELRRGRFRLQEARASYEEPPAQAKFFFGADV